MLERTAKTTLAVEKFGKPGWNLHLILLKNQTAKATFARENCGKPVWNLQLMLEHKNRKQRRLFAGECGKPAHITEEPKSKDDFICGEMRKNSSYF